MVAVPSTLDSDYYAWVHRLHDGNPDYGGVNYYNGVRPAVSLSKKVKLSGEGNGTVESPYILAPLD